jgi:RNA polymerase sigma-70 factor (ECF subfamily)
VQQDRRLYPKQVCVTLGAIDEEVADSDPDLEAALGAAQDAARLRAYVEELLERQRALIRLVFFKEMTCAAIADVESPKVRSRAVSIKPSSFFSAA